MPDHRQTGPVQDKFRLMPVAWLEERLKLRRDAPPLCDHPSTAALLTWLEQAGQSEAAICLVANALPPREAVWWGCMCARHTVSPADAAGADQAALEAAEHWVRAPGGPTRATAYRTAHRARFRSPEAMAAMGAFWTGALQTLSMQDETARAQQRRSVENAVRMALLRGPNTEQQARLRAFLQSAREIAQGEAGRLDRPKAAEANAAQSGA